MDFPLFQLYQLNRSKPIVVVDGIDGDLQWDECDLTGLPPERTDLSPTDHGRIPKGQWDNLPKMFKAIDGKKYPINNKLIDNAIASIISPMVIGSFSILKFIIENSDARIRRIVLNSRTSNFLFSISENV